jgi:electron transport complex protein RnfB
MNNYEKLRANLHKNPAGAPASKVLDKILETLFTPAEVDVAICMTFVPKPLSVIAEKAGLKPKAAKELCESMANKGIIYSREKNGEAGYSLLPLIPGVFEFPFMAGGGTAMHKKLGVLWEEYHYENQGYEFGSSPTPLTRVMPIEESLKETSEILPYEILSEMMKRNTTFALAECACRVSAGDNACDKPNDVCLIFDKTADFLIERNLAKKITLDQAMDVLKRSEEAGLVHMTNNSQDRINLICNCCPCCCTILTGLTKIKSPHPFAVGRWYADVDETTCTGCGICHDDRCPVEAIQIEDGTAVVTKETCIGCGLCTSECPEESIVMKKREESVAPPATVLEMGANVLMEKGRLEAFMELNNS